MLEVPNAIQNSTGSSKTPPPLLFGGDVLFLGEQENHQASVFRYPQRPSDRPPGLLIPT